LNPPHCNPRRFLGEDIEQWAYWNSQNVGSLFDFEFCRLGLD
jgi:hypothetical protein